MKTRKNKKFYNFTEKQIRRDRTRKTFYWTVPKSFRQIFNKEKKAKNRQALRKLLQGKEVFFEKETNDVRWWCL